MAAIIIASIALFLATVQASFAVYRWLREPVFDVLTADFAAAGEGLGRYVDLESIVVLARGGARPRRVVNWQIVGGPPDELSSGGMNPVLTQAIIDIPANETTRFTIHEQWVRMTVDEHKRLRVHLTLDLGVYFVPLTFFIKEMGDRNFHLERSRLELATGYAYEWQRKPRWKRAILHIRHRFL